MYGKREWVNNTIPLLSRFHPCARIALTAWRTSGGIGPGGFDGSTAGSGLCDPCTFLSVTSKIMVLFVIATAVTIFVAMFLLILGESRPETGTKLLKLLGSPYPTTRLEQEPLMVALRACRRKGHKMDFSGVQPNKSTKCWTQPIFLKGLILVDLTISHTSNMVSTF